MGQWDDKFDRAAAKWESWQMHDYPQDERVLHKIIEDKARQNPNHVVFQFRDDPITLGELNDGINRAANGYLALGLQPGDKVAIMLPNCPEFLYSWFGLNKIGAVEVPINVALKGDGLTYQIVQSDCVALLADVEYLDRLEGIASDLKTVRNIIFTDKSNSGTAFPDWSGFETLSYHELSDRPATTPDATTHFSDLASILYTSGTTGVSKGVMLSHHYWYEIWSESVKYSRATRRMTSSTRDCPSSTAMPRESPSGRPFLPTPRR